MPARPDCIFEALRSQGFIGANSDMMLQWAQANGGTSNVTTEAVLQALQANGATSGLYNDAWYEVLTLLGLTGANNDMLYEFWCVLGGTFGFGAINAAMGSGNDTVIVTFNAVPQDFDPVAGVVILVDGVDDLKTGSPAILSGQTLEYPLNSSAPNSVLVEWQYSEPPGLISDGTDLAPSRNLTAQFPGTGQGRWELEGAGFWELEGGGFWELET
jgi:hypothetical protein